MKNIIKSHSKELKQQSQKKVAPINANCNHPLILITGTPKSATQYTSMLLNRCGICVGHEDLDVDGTADWMLAPGKKSNPFDGSSWQDFDVVLHQVRHPLHTMSSMQRISKTAALYILDYLPDGTRKMDPIEMGMLVYYHWNLIAEKTASWTYRIESLYSDWNKFCKKIQHPELKKYREQVQILPKDINSAKPYPEITWAYCEEANAEITKKLKGQAKRYGYKC